MCSLAWMALVEKNFAKWVEKNFNWKNAVEKKKSWHGLARGKVLGFGTGWHGYFWRVLAWVGMGKKKNTEKMLSPGGVVVQGGGCRIRRYILFFEDYWTCNLDR